MAIIKSDVPTAVLKGSPVRNTNAGIIKNHHLLLPIQ